MWWVVRLGRRLRVPCGKDTITFSFRDGDVRRGGFVRFRSLGCGARLAGMLCKHEMF